MTIVAAWLLAATGGADAQTTFAELQQRVKPGDKVSVTDQSGQVTRGISGIEWRIDRGTKATIE